LRDTGSPEDRRVVTTRIRTPLILLACLASVRIAVAEPEAERLYNEGQAAYDAKHYDDAIAAWEQSYALGKLPALLFNLGQANRLANHCTRAVEAYRKFLAAAPDAADAPTARDLVRELEPCPDTPKPPPKPPPPKPHQVEPRVPVDQQPHVVDHGRGKRVAGVVTLGAGAALLATGIYFGNHATSLANEVEAACTGGCEWATVEDKDAAGRRAAKLQYVFYGAGVGAVAAGAVMYLLGARARSVVVEPRDRGIAVTMRW